MRAPAPLCALFDNGSLRPEATLNLRTNALRLQAAIGANVHPVSLLHSSAVPSSQLGGVPAQLLEPALGLLLKAAIHDIVLLPLFFGPRAAAARSMILASPCWPHSCAAQGMRGKA